MDIEENCYDFDRTDTETLMSDWENTHSPLVYWFSQMRSDNYNPRYKTPMIDDINFGHAEIYHKLPSDEAARVCESRYKNELVLVNIQIGKSTAMQIKKDVRVSFSDQLATIGNDSFIRLIIRKMSFIQGGALGLFTGVSIISLIELVFWIQKVSYVSKYCPFIVSPFSGPVQNYQRNKKILRYPKS